MRKFKIKNRQKRRYTRRQELGSTSSFSLSAIAGLLPSILLAITLSISLIINSHSIDYTVNIQNPFDGLSTFFMQQVTQSLHAASHNQVKIAFTPPPLLSSWSIQSGINFVLYGLQVSMQTVINSMIVIYTVFIHFLILLNPIPLIFILAKGLGMLFILCIHAVILGFVYLFTSVIHLYQIFFNGLLTFEKNIFLAIQTIFAFFGSISTYLFSQIVMIVLIVIHVIFSIFENILNGIMWLIKGIIRLIELPFLVVWSYILKLNPIWHLLGNSISQCASVLAAGIDSLLSIIAFIANASNHQ